MLFTLLMTNNHIYFLVYLLGSSTSLCEAELHVGWLSLWVSGILPEVMQITVPWFCHNVIYHNNELICHSLSICMQCKMSWHVLWIFWLTEIVLTSVSVFISGKLGIVDFFRKVAFEIILLTPFAHIICKDFTSVIF